MSWGRVSGLRAAFVVVVVLLLGVIAVRVHDASRPHDVWRDGDGHPVPETTVVSYAGPEHCGWQQVVFLEIGYRSGLTEPGLSGRLTFLRDPEGVLARYVAAPYAGEVTLPRDAVPTGWRRDGAELWLAPDGSAAYVRSGGEHVERWPRSAPHIACA